VVTLTLIVNPNLTGDTTATICANQLPFTWYQNTLNAAGTATHTFTSAAGCDSVVTLTLIVNLMYLLRLIPLFVQDAFHFTWNGINISSWCLIRSQHKVRPVAILLVTLNVTVSPVITATSVIIQYNLYRFSRSN
jgi:hypothetical protein